MIRHLPATVLIVTTTALAAEGCRRTGHPPTPKTVGRPTATDAPTANRAATAQQAAGAREHERARGEHQIETAAGEYRIRFTTDPTPVPLNAMFSMRVVVRDASGHDLSDQDVSLDVDATMPAHRHGMNTRPRTTFSDRAFEVRGMLFHMPGLWQIHFDVTRAGITSRGTFDVDLE